jgi:predicted  nucleic acid-binding Zn-ribbon protein
MSGRAAFADRLTRFRDGLGRENARLRRRIDSLESANAALRSVIAALREERASNRKQMRESVKAIERWRTRAEQAEAALASGPEVEFRGEVR